MIEETQQTPELATPQHRLAAIALEVGLFFATLFIGYIIWTLVTWGQGQTPGKQILKLRTLNVKSNKPASWGQMFLRQFILPNALTIPFSISISVYDYAYLDAVGSRSALLGMAVGTILYLILQVVDIVWIFGPSRRRLLDYWCGTVVVNESNIKSK